MSSVQSLLTETDISDETTQQAQYYLNKYLEPGLGPQKNTEVFDESSAKYDAVSKYSYAHYIFISIIMVT